MKRVKNEEKKSHWWPRDSSVAGRKKKPLLISLLLYEDLPFNHNPHHKVPSGEYCKSKFTSIIQTQFY